MKRIHLYALLFMTVCFCAFTYLAPPDPWKPAQLIKPADLAAIIQNPNAVKPLIICVGPSPLIKGAISTGEASRPEGMEKFKAEIAKHKKTKEIVIYCGCCTMQNCPNIRPAFEWLNKNGYKKHKLLAIEESLQQDWTGKDYPMEKK
jgi:thiosulfate/3-mercaptopyruvate sulfurtransferase